MQQDGDAWLTRGIEKVTVDHLPNIPSINVQVIPKHDSWAFVIYRRKKLEARHLQAWYPRFMKSLDLGTEGAEVVQYRCVYTPARSHRKKK